MSRVLKKIPHSRQVLYLFLCAIIPPTILFVSKWQQLRLLNELEERILFVQEEKIVYTKEQAVNLKTREAFKGSDRFYIDKELESMSFLKSEREHLISLVNNPYFAGDKQVTRRLEHLTGKINRLLFSEGKMETTPHYQEKVVTQMHPVQVNAQDLKQILSKIEGTEFEGVEKGTQRPHLLPLEFKLGKTEPTPGNEVYTLHMQLLHKEYP